MLLDNEIDVNFSIVDRQSLTYKLYVNLQRKKKKIDKNVFVVP